MNEQDQDDKLLGELGMPYVGMPATYMIGGDQYAGKIIAISKTRHRVTWQRGEGGSYAHECTRRRNGVYYVLGSKYGYLKLGVAKTILDEGF